MRSWILVAGAAALAINAPALADPNKGGGKGQGGSHQGQKQQQAAGDRGGGKSARGGGQSMRQAKPDRVERQAAARPDRGQGDKRDVRVEDRGASKVRTAKADNGHSNQGRGNGGVIVDNDGDAVRLVRRDFSDGTFFRSARVPFGCPPGLDKKDNGCLPPGLAKKLLGAPLVATFANDRIPFQYRNWYPDNDDFYYRSGDGFIYRVNRSNNLVDGLIPLFGGGGYYALGDPWPQPYNFYNVPMQYQSYWPNGGDYNYRYSDGAIYRLDPSTNVVSGIVALLAGDLGVGSRLPLGYDAYNVPMAYRAQYYDTPDSWYRYNDGYIYRVDPTTRLITAVIDAIV